MDVKCSSLLKERLKYTELSTRLSDENKKLYKKWYQIKKNETKFQSRLIDQMNKRSKQNEKIQNTNKSKNQVDFDDFLSVSSFSLCEENFQKIYSRNDNQRVKKIASNKFFRKKTLLLFRQNLILIKQLNHLNGKNLKINKEMDIIDLKLKQTANQNEKYLSEIANLKKKESDYKYKEEDFKKQGDQIKDEIKKAHDIKCKQISSDLSKQIVVARGLRSENEKLLDKLKVCEEKLNHTERDNSQKKQLIDFYKKKIG